MPAKLSKRIVLRDFYCLAPPLTTSPHVLLPPRLSRAEEARGPHAPLRPVKREIRESESESVEFVVDEEEVERPIKVERQVKIEPDPRQLSVRIAAIAIRPKSTASTVPFGQLGPADPPRGCGRPKGSKSRPRIPKIYGLPVPPERAAAARACEEMTALSNRS